MCENCERKEERKDLIMRSGRAAQVAIETMGTVIMALYNSIPLNNVDLIEQMEKEADLDAEEAEKLEILELSIKWILCRGVEFKKECEEREREGIKRLFESDQNRAADGTA